MKDTIVSHCMSNRYNNAKYMTIAETITHKLQAGEFQALGHFYSVTAQCNTGRGCG